MLRYDVESPCLCRGVYAQLVLLGRSRLATASLEVLKILVYRDEQPEVRLPGRTVRAARLMFGSDGGPLTYIAGSMPRSRSLGGTG